MPSQPARNGLSFFGMVGMVMGALKLKQGWDEYKAVSTEEEEGRVALTSPYRDAAGDDELRIGLLDTELPTNVRPKKKKSSCCVCCGINCGIFWKAFGIVLLGVTVWNAIKLIRWAVTDAPTGLENMPAFSSSLGCQNAPFIYNQSTTVFNVPLSEHSSHAFSIQGDAVGTFVIAEGAANATDVKYEMTLRTEDETLLKFVNIHYPEPENPTVNRFRISTPRPIKACMRYDIKMYVPPTLKRLDIAARAKMHIQFDASANVDLDSLFVTMYKMDKENMILPTTGVRGKNMALEVYRGWIVGDVAIVEETNIKTQRGDGATNIRAHPWEPVDGSNPEPACLRTTTGAGRTDVFYIASKAFKRLISNYHLSSRNGDVFLNYKEAEFNGRVGLDSKSYSATGLVAFSKALPGEDTPKWTHWRGDKEGGDSIVINSRVIPTNSDEAVHDVQFYRRRGLPYAPEKAMASPIAMTASTEANRTWVVYLALIGAIMAALKLKETWDEYRYTMAEEAARIVNARHDATGGNEPRVDLELLSRRRTKPKPTCCVCCGIDLLVFWKAVGLLILSIVTKNVLIRAFKGTPTGLEGMPAFSTSLQCQNAPFIYNKTTAIFDVPIQEQALHTFEIDGGAVGTLLITRGQSDAVDVHYEMILRAEDESLLELVKIQQPTLTKDDAVKGGLRISTPPSLKSCMRYDIKLYVPPLLKDLRIVSHTRTHLQLDPESDIELDQLSIHLNGRDPDNMILPTTTIRAKKTTLQIGRGWVVGDLTIVDEAEINTKQGNGVTNLHVYPAEPTDMENPEPANLITSAGSGRTDIFYISSKVFKRPILSSHSSRKGDIYLHYQHAEFRGKVALGAMSSTTYGLQPFPKSSYETGETASKWTLWSGDKKGGDSLIVSSNGWVGLYVLS